MLKLANIVFEDLRKELLFCESSCDWIARYDFVLISPHGGMNHFIDEFEKVKNINEFDKKTLYIISSYAEGHLEEETLKQIWSN